MQSQTPFSEKKERHQERKGKERKETQRKEKTRKDRKKEGRKDSKKKEGCLKKKQGPHQRSSCSTILASQPQQLRPVSLLALCMASQVHRIICQFEQEKNENGFFFKHLSCFGDLSLALPFLSEFGRLSLFTGRVRVDVCWL